MNYWWIRLTRYARPHRLGLTSVTLLMLGGVGLEVLKPWPMKLIIDCVLSDRPLPVSAAWLRGLPFGASRPGLLGLLTLATVVLFLAGWAGRTAQGYVQAGVGSRMTYGLAVDLFDRLQRLSLRFHGRQPAGDLVHRVTQSTGCVRELILNFYLPLITSLTSLGMMLAVMWRLDRTLSILALVTIPLLGLTIRVLSGPMAERSHEEMQVQGEAYSLAEQTLTALPVVRAFGQEDREDRRFSVLQNRVGRAYLRTISAQLAFQVATGTVTALGTAAVLWVGGIHVLDAEISVGTLVVFVSYLASLYTPLESLAYLSMGFATASAGAKRVFEIMESDDCVRDRPRAKTLTSRSTGRVLFESVDFGYEPGRPVLHGIDIEATPGETVALVGPTGAGKSTLVSLIPRFFDPWKGRILLDGRDIRDIRIASLRAHMAIVLQDPFLLPMTLAENIAYGRPQASRADIERAAVDANADGFIRGLPKGFDTVIGERGATLSLGQRQRLSIARAFLKDAPILILDEPTSALDAATEASLIAALERLMIGRTTFIIAHRLSTIRRASRIVVIDKGRTVENGTHRDLLQLNRIYRRYYDLQQQGPAHRLHAPIRESLEAAVLEREAAR